MTDRGPWSVKGIDQRARDAAREAAREEGMTLGQYLNRLLLEENGREAGLSGDPKPRKPENATNALDRLARRLESAEARSTLAITGIDQSIHGLLARLEDTEHSQQVLGSHVETVIDELQETHEALRDKVRQLEEDDSGERNLEALKGLEQALGKLASHVYEEQAMAQDEAEAIKARIETGLGEAGERLDGMEAKVESTLSEAAKRIEQAVEQAELRAEGATRHLSDRFSTMETSVVQKLDEVDQIATRVSSVEGDVSDALNSMEGTLLRMQERLHRAETTTDAALKALEGTFDSLDKRIETVARHASPEAAEELRRQFELRFEGLADDLKRSVEHARAEMAREIEQASRAANPALVQKLETSLTDMDRRLGEAEARQARGFDKIGDQIDRVNDRVDQRIDAIEARDNGEVADSVRVEVQASLADMERQLGDAERRQTQAIESVGDQMNRISSSLDQRLAAVETGADGGAVKVVREEVAALAGSLESRMVEIETRETHAIERVGADMSRLADHLEQRVTESEQRSASAIEQVGEQVSGVALRLQQRQDAALQSISETIETNAKRSEARLSDALSNVSDRLSRIQDQAANSLSPVQKAIGSLAQRIEALEDFASPPFSEPAAAALPAMAAPEPVDTQIDPAPRAEPASGDVSPDPAATASNADEISPLIDEISSVVAPGDKPGPARPSEQEDQAGGLVKSADGAGWDEEFEAGLEGWGLETRRDGGGSVEDAADAFAGDDLNEASLGDGDAASNDPLSDLVDWDDGRSEARDSDVFDAEEPAAEAAADAADEASADAETGKEPGAPVDYLARARAAAQAAASAPASVKKKHKVPTFNAAEEGEKRSGGKAPLIAAASAIALVSAGATAYLSLRGRTVSEPILLTNATLPAPAEPAREAHHGPQHSEAGDLADGDPDDLFEENEASAMLEDLPAPETVAAAPVFPAEPIPPQLTLEAAAARGNHVAQFIIGERRLAEEDYARGPALVQAAAEGGLAIAQYRLAKLHEKGLGVARDLAAARQWTQRAANGGNTAAMHDLAVFYAEGESGPQSYARAVEWFRKASEYGVVDSQYNLAILYERGFGVTADPAEALFWFEVAARSGDPGAPQKVAELRQSISFEAAQAAQRRAATWAPARADDSANGVFAAQPWDAPQAGQIAAIQQTLNALGYNAGAPDGAVGPQTMTAIRAFARENGLSSAGAVDQALIDRLNDAAAAAREQLG
ncbi:MAG: peptidoglycan-binding protein [Pseudomonadota bacterium]